MVYHGPMLFTDNRIALILTVAVSLSASAWTRESDPPDALLVASGISGGLCVQIGAGDVVFAQGLAAGGKFLVHLADVDSASTHAARVALRERGLYGLVSVTRIKSLDQLPYAENLVNLIVLREDLRDSISLPEIERVLCPLGVLATPSHPELEQKIRGLGFEKFRKEQIGNTAWLFARKPWPKAMDSWPQSRRAADGNSVSLDRLVGPPRRVRWVTGPSREISNMVSSRGKNYYAGVLARDGFNGLPLWNRSVTPSPARGGYGFPATPGSVSPIAVDDFLIVVSEGKVLALSGATGEILRDYPAAGRPRTILHEAGTLIAVDSSTLRALDIRTAESLWNVRSREHVHVVSGDGAVFAVQGDERRGDRLKIVRRVLASGESAWRKPDPGWLSGVKRSVYHDGLLAFEVSTLSDEKARNAVHVLDAENGDVLWSRGFHPGMTHFLQARALFAGKRLWILSGKKCLGLDPRSGSPEVELDAGYGHCFPPVSTDRFLFAGEMDVTDLETGVLEKPRITKGACSYDAGFVLANGLIYTFPKHCVCWPMLRGYTALAADSTSGNQAKSPDVSLDRRSRAKLESEVATPGTNWPGYRHDAWRSGASVTQVPEKLDVIWSVELGDWPGGRITSDWHDDPFVDGPLTGPVVAGGRVFVARPESHELVALDMETGSVVWRFIADGRVDSPPTIYRGNCVFGTRSGWVYCLRSRDGALNWRARVSPSDERIISYGQLESPWPVAGSVLVVDDVAFVAAGRQASTDGGVRVLALEIASGEVLWQKRIDRVPQTDFYGGESLEFEAFDLLHREGAEVTMSRWRFDRKSGEMNVAMKSGFARLKPGSREVVVPRGWWSYGARYESETEAARPFRRPLVVFRDGVVFGCSQDRRVIFRRDFDAKALASFDTEWYRKSAAYEAKRRGGDFWRSERLARDARWSSTAFRKPSQETVAALVLTRDVLFVLGESGSLGALSPLDGSLLSERRIAAPVWDGMAAASGRLFVSTRDGRVVALGDGN